MKADLVRSTGLTEPVFRELADAIEARVGVEEGSDFNGFYKGDDSFQCRLPDAARACRLALRLRTMAIGAGGSEEGSPLTDLRVSIGMGPVFDAGGGDLRPPGMAWVESGRGLDALKRGERRLAMVGPDAGINIALEAVSRFLDHIFAKLTAKQAEVLGLLLEGMTQTEIARRLEKSQSTVNSHAQAMGWREVEGLLRLYAQAVEKTGY